MSTPPSDDKEIASHSPISALPAELLDRIFSSLSDRKDVSSTRLVCQWFKELSSPYSITRVVFAHRVDTLLRLYDVLEHEYFRKHISELVYDVAQYARPYAIHRGRTTCEGAIGTTNPHFARIQQHSADLNAEYASLIRRCLQHPISTSERLSLSDKLSSVNSQTRTQAGCDVDWEESRLAWTDSSVEIAALRQAVAGFPNLKTFTFGDHGDVMRKGAVAPRFLSDGHSQKLYEALSRLATCKANIRTLQVGGHERWLPPGEYDLEYCNMSIATNIIDARPSSKNQFGRLSKCRSLALAVQTINYRAPYEDGITQAQILRSYTSHMIRAASNTLKILKLGAVDRILPYNTTSPFYRTRTPVGQSILGMALFSIRFPMLEQLTLRGWAIQPQEFLQFLTHMRSTLKVLRLDYNIVIGDSLELARRGGQQMLLQGVSICNYEQWQEDEKSFRIGRDLACESLWLEERVNAIQSVATLHGAQQKVTKSREGKDKNNPGPRMPRSQLFAPANLS